jgi:hypothetical protein
MAAGREAVIGRVFIAAAALLPVGCQECSGETDGTGTVVDTDDDNDGVCNDDEIEGCNDVAACNYNAATTDATDTCVYADAGSCEVCSGATDGTGVVVDVDDKRAMLTRTGDDKIVVKRSFLLL